MPSSVTCDLLTYPLTNRLYVVWLACLHGFHTCFSDFRPFAWRKRRNLQEYHDLTSFALIAQDFNWSSVSNLGKKENKHARRHALSRREKSVDDQRAQGSGLKIRNPARLYTPKERGNLHHALRTRTPMSCPSYSLELPDH